MKNVILSSKAWAAVAALTLASLSAASPANAVSFNGTFSADRLNNVGSTFANMTASATTFCYLSRIQVTETDTGAETAECKITRGPIVWVLEAILGASSDADVRCSAICYNN